MIWSLIWFWLLGIFTTADVITTKVALSMGFYEGNSVLSPSIAYLIPLKIAFLLFVIAVVVWVENRREGHGWIPVSGAACVTFAAVVWNMGQTGGLM
jgi:hypothetical protein